ncbi:MarR family winged helix-turn-helix transcriptional regulator [Neorhizobium galegae]|uniref:Transcriptional regulator n=1 Tax=Neorhizobium galegae bv. officinalis TaxID=323656 RepID=A0A0T7GVC0_NEOGA|nr:MarR family winged helix-turn-helix transcriptional regulator [Neorhizobium galegae]CDZ51241.1 Transcriptional regulator [Neorhizobium galegae bv. officinalis]
MTEEGATSPRKLSKVVPYRLARSNAEMMKLVSLLCEANGFKLNIWRVMSAIGTYRSISPMELTTIDKAMVSRAIRELVDRDLIDRRADARDARWAQIQLTAAGTAVYEKMVAGINALEKHMFGDLPPEKTAAFMEMLELIERRARLARDMVELNGKAGLARLLGRDAE